MAYDIDQIINDFLRDAQYRIGELGIEMDQSRDDGKYPFSDKQRSVAELVALMNILWWSKDEIKDGYNFIYGGSDNQWTEKEVVLEIEKMRDKAGLNPVPYLSFINHATELVSGTGATAGLGLPIGSFGQYITYDIAGNPVAADFPVYGGMNVYEDINSYFAGR